MKPCLAALFSALFLTACSSLKPLAPQRPPNFVVIFCDDLGYGDIGCFGSKTPTPNIDRMAREGVRLTDFYVGQAVCSASRSALLTGCYPSRVSIQGALGPHSKTGLNPDEQTIAEVLKTRGYATAIYGKWHLGDAPEFLPTRQGFDEWYGLPYSNDMWPNHPTDKSYPPLPLYVNETIVQLMPDQSQLTRQYTEHAVGFIDRNKDQPFFLYVPHSMPHVPIFASTNFAGRTGQGLYADVVAEIDWSVGQILAALKKNGLDDNTLVVFTSDNGPWQVFGNHAGSTGGLRESKGTSFDGGSRVPFVARWPKQIPAGTVQRKFAGTIDLLPTFAKLAGAAVPTDRKIDGGDMWPLLADRPGATSPREAQIIYYGRHLDAVRVGDWKLHLDHDYRTTAIAGRDGAMGKYGRGHIAPSLFDLATDPNETKDLSAQHPEVMARLTKLAEATRDDLGDTNPTREGKGVRPPGRIQ
jgi:arylsulfatase A